MRLLLSAFLFVTLGGAASASAPSCEVLTAAAERTYGLPPNLLTAIAQTESGRRARGARFRAWPWTSNIRGKGRYYASRQEALAHLDAVLDEGIVSFDVGCMQLNYRWHGQNFPSLAAMLEPAENVDYAARYLKELKAETGSWEIATRYYHSRDAERGRAYFGRVRRARARIGPEAPAVPETTRVASLHDAPSPVMPVADAPRIRATAVDKRFQGATPLVELEAAAPYWAHPSLGSGAVPRMP
ncbi:MAG: transglycosylase SLT domain-containing protein [Pseudomonadota bacterium]